MPIIKSIGRKDRGFKQLLDYLYEQEGVAVDTFTFLHNIFISDPDNRQAIVQAFVQNDNYRKRRSNGNVMYHEMISFHPKDKEALQKNPEILERIVEEYVDRRAPNALVVAKPHLDKSHYHIHLMISANEHKSSVPIRISKERYFEIHKEIEVLQSTVYPILTHSFASGYGKKKGINGELKISDNEWQLRKRRGITKKEETRVVVIEALRASKSLGKLRQQLKNNGFDLYTRGGKVNGVKRIETNKRYRFTTLLKKNTLELMKINRWNENNLVKKEVVRRKQEAKDISYDLELSLQLEQA